MLDLAILKKQALYINGMSYMKKFSLLIFTICLNVIFAFLLINKQNKKVTLLYEIQKLKEQRDQLLESKKNLLLEVHKEEQLSAIQNFAQTELEMSPIKIQEIKAISLSKE